MITMLPQHDRTLCINAISLTGGLASLLIHLYPIFPIKRSCYAFILHWNRIHLCLLEKIILYRETVVYEKKDNHRQSQQKLQCKEYYGIAIYSLYHYKRSQS